MGERPARLRVGILSPVRGRRRVPVTGADRAGVVAWNNICRPLRTGATGRSHPASGVGSFSAQGRESTVGLPSASYPSASRATVLLRHRGGLLNETVGSRRGRIGRSLQEWEEGAKRNTPHQVDLRPATPSQHSVVQAGTSYRIHTAAPTTTPAPT